MIQYQIHKSCKSIFYNGAIHENTKCPFCNELITDFKKQIKIKDENKLNKSDLVRLKRTQKVLDKKQKQAEKDKKKAEREQKKVEREEKKRLREERRAIRGNKESIKIITKKINLGDNWIVDYWIFEELPENLVVKEGFNEKYIIAQSGPSTNDYEAGYFIKIKEKINKYYNDYEVEYYDEDLRIHTVPLKSVRKYLRGHDKLGKIHTIEQYLKRNRGA